MGEYTPRKVRTHCNFHYIHMYMCIRDDVCFFLIAPKLAFSKKIAAFKAVKYRLYLMVFSMLRK